MLQSSLDGTARKTDRLEAFSDAVLAIAMTLPVVELHAPQPEEGDLAAVYLKLMPEYAAYALSVIFIGLHWANSHFSGKPLTKTYHGFNLLSIGFLAAVSITPFPSRPLIEHLAGDPQSRTATLFYLGVAASPATWWFLRWTYAVRRKLADPQLTDAYLGHLTLKYSITAAAFWIAFVLAFRSWRVGLVAAVVVTLSYVVPAAKPLYRAT